MNEWKRIWQIHNRVNAGKKIYHLIIKCLDVNKAHICTNKQHLLLYHWVFSWRIIERKMKCMTSHIFHLFGFHSFIVVDIVETGNRTIFFEIFWSKQQKINDSEWDNLNNDDVTIDRSVQSINRSDRLILIFLTQRNWWW